MAENIFVIPRPFSSHINVSDIIRASYQSMKEYHRTVTPALSYLNEKDWIMEHRTMRFHGPRQCGHSSAIAAVIREMPKPIIGGTSLSSIRLMSDRIRNLHGQAFLDSDVRYFNLNARNPFEPIIKHMYETVLIDDWQLVADVRKTEFFNSLATIYQGKTPPYVFLLG